MIRLFAIAALLSACATTSPYVGPVQPPTVDGTEWLWHNIDGRLRRETTLHVVNSTRAPLDAILDCDPESRHARKWPGTRLAVHVPPMTVQHVLLDQHDHVCNLLPYE